MHWDPSAKSKYSATGHWRLLKQLREDLSKKTVNYDYISSKRNKHIEKKTNDLIECQQKDNPSLTKTTGYTSAAESKETTPTPNIKPIEEIEETTPTPNIKPIEEIEETTPTPNIKPIEEIKVTIPTPSIKPIEEIKVTTPTPSIKPEKSFRERLNEAMMESTIKSENQIPKTFRDRLKDIEVR